LDLLEEVAGLFDVYMLEGETLMVARPKGTLDASEAMRIVDFIEIEEIETETGFNRFCDLTRLDGISLSSEDIVKLAARRRAFNPNNIHVKSAFLATHPLAYAISCLYQDLLNSPRIQVRVFSELEDAAEWLAVTPDRLKL
jgi:hypothetical protein